MLVSLARTSIHIRALKYLYLFWGSIEWPAAGVPFERCLLVYKSAFLLNNVSNNAFGKLLIPVFKLCAVLLVIVSSFGLIGFWNNFDIITLGIAIVATVAALVCIIPSADIMPTLYDTSARLEQNLNKNSEYLDYKWQKQNKRQVRACQPIRCQVGSLYYMDSKAKLTLAHTLINGLVFLLVQRKS